MPIIKNDTYRQLLVTNSKHSTKKVSTVPKVPQLTTPLVTKFEKWSGKKRKLLFQDESHVASCGIKNFELNNNIFAQMLASPMRSERNCKTKMPKEFMMQLKLRSKHEYDSGDCSRPLELKPAAVHSKLNKNSYVVNSRELLSQLVKASGRWIPISVLISQMRFFQIQDVSIDTSKFLSDYEDSLASLLRKNLTDASNFEWGLRSGDVIVCFEKENNRSVEIKKCQSKDGKDMELLIFNLKFIGPHWEQFINEHRNHESGNIVLRLPENRDAVKLLYKMLAYYYR